MLQVEKAVHYTQDHNALDDVEANQFFEIEPETNQLIELEPEDNQLLELELFEDVADEANSDMQLVPVLNDRDSESDFSSFDRDSKFNILSITSHSTDANSDPLTNLPPNWAQLDFKNKKNCITSKIYATDVTKAINKLESLQDNIEKVINKLEANGSSVASSASCLEPSRFVQYVKKRSLNTLSTKRSDIKFIEKEQSDQNKGLSSLDLIVKKSELAPSQDPSTDMKMGSILEEVLMLLARLEYDRRRSELQLKSEKENFTRLKNQIESMAIRRAMLLPKCVQEEHDKNVSDISELKFHILFSTKSEEKLSRKIEVEQKVYRRLSAEIKNIQSTMPLIEEKIKIENDLLYEVEQEQESLDEQLRKANERREAAEEKTVVALNKARMEREEMEAELSECRRELNKAKKRHQDSLDKADGNIQFLINCKNKITENIEAEKEEIQKKISTKKRNERLHEEIKVTKAKRVEIEKENQGIEFDNNQFSEKLNEKTAVFNAEIEKLTETYTNKREKLEKVLKKKKEKEIDIEEMDRHRSQVENKIEKEERNKERLKDEQSKIEDELSSTNTIYANTIKSSGSTSNDQEKEMKRLEQRETVLKKQIMDLKKQITEERNAAAVLLSKMKMETEDYVRAQSTAATKQSTFEAKKIELDKRIAEIEIKVNEVEIRKTKIEAEVEVLSKELNVLLAEHKELETERLAQIAKLEPQHANNTINFNKNTDSLDHIKRHTIEQTNRVAEMKSSIKIMKEHTEKANAETVELTGQYNELVIQVGNLVILDEKSKVALAVQIERMTTTDDAHDGFMAIREDYLIKIQEQLNDNCKANTELASRYRELKYGIYNVKLDIMRSLDAKLDQFTNMKDMRQLKSVQNRMHAALRDFFVFKIKHSENNYDNLQGKKDSVGERIGSLEDLMVQSTRHVTRFLHKQMDFSQVRRMAMEKVKKDEEEKLKKANDENKNTREVIMKLNGKVNVSTMKTKILPPIGMNLVNPV